MTAKGSPWGSRQPAGRAILRSGTSGTRVPGRARGMHVHTSCPPWPRGTHLLGQAEQARIQCPLGKDSVPTQQHLAFESNCRSGPWVPSSFAVARSCDLRLRLPTQAEVPQGVIKKDGKSAGRGAGRALTKFMVGPQLCSGSPWIWKCSRQRSGACSSSHSPMRVIKKDGKSAGRGARRALTKFMVGPDRYHEAVPGQFCSGGPWI
jgi:hypothetical protein